MELSSERTQQRTARPQIGPEAWLARDYLLVSGLALVGLLVTGLALRIYCLDCHGYWGDEVSSIDGARLGLPGIFTGRFGWIVNQTPVYYLLVWLTIQPVDPAVSSILVRLPSALAGALTPLAVYGLGREMFGRAQGFLAAALISLSAVALNYSQDLRLYSVFLLLTTLSIYCLLAALRTDSTKWWVGFVAATIVDISYAYIALTVMLPALLVYLLPALGSLFSRKDRRVRRFSHGLISLAAVGLFSLAMLLDMAKVPRPAPDWTQLSILSPVWSTMELLTWFTQFGLPGQLERFVQAGLLVLSFLGFAFAVRGRYARPQSVFLAGLFIIVPCAVLAVFSTTNVVFQRYAIFAMPFYFLLISHGVVSAAKFLATVGNKGPSGKLLVLIPGLGMGLVLSAFPAGAYNYYTPSGHMVLSYRPDFRGAAHYLSRQVKPADIIIFLDDPGLGFTISNFYWEGKPPAPIYDARDPRLLTQSPQGDIYWVVSFEDMGVLDAVSSPNLGWSDVGRFELVSVLHQQNAKGSIIPGMERLVLTLEALRPGYQPVVTLRGCLYQAHGDVAGAVRAYRAAGTYFPVGEDYLRTAEGFDALGDDVKAWREADISKFWQPAKPQVHRWFAAKLASEGITAESQVEAAIADALQGSP